MSIKSLLYTITVSASVVLTHAHSHHSPITDPGQTPLNDPTIPINGIPFSTRAYWMRQANAALDTLTGTPCPFAAFGTVIVNHTDPSTLGELICMGANSNAQSGNPTLHGEIAAINNCNAIFTDPGGEYRLSASEALAAFEELTLYTNAESCPMCASAIRWAGMREYVFGTSIETLVWMGWGQIDISSKEVFERSKGLRNSTGGTEVYFLMGDVLTNETDVYFGWQFDEKGECPPGCGRVKGMCQAAVDEEGARLHDEI